MADRKINGSVHITGTTYGPGQEEALNGVIEASEIKYLTDKGILEGDWTGVKDGSREQTNPTQRQQGLTNPGGSGGTARIEETPTGAHIDANNVAKYEGAREPGAILSEETRQRLEAGVGTAPSAETPLPRVDDLADSIQDMSDDDVRAMQARDTRATAQPIYERRLATT